MRFKSTSLEIFINHQKGINQKSTNQEEVYSDSEDDMDIAMIDQVFTQDDDDQTSLSSNNKTLRQVLRPLGKFRLDFVKDVRKLYNMMRQQEYQTQGKRLPVGDLLTLDEEKAFGKYLYQMMTCLKPPFRENIHLFNINSSMSLKETIYYAFIQARDNLSQTKKKYHKTIDEQVHLALRWSINDITENQSETNAKIWNDPNKVKQNRLLLIDALSKNLVLFVMNFVNLDIDFIVLFGPIRTPSRGNVNRWSRKSSYLKELYSDTKRKNSDPLYLLDQISTKIDFTEEKHLVIVLKKLVGDFMHPLYEDQSKVRLTLLKTEEEGTDIENADAEYIYRDLFLWCVLTYRLDMAKIFLSQMKSRICSALIASKILKSLSTYAPDHVAKGTLYSKASDFENYAIEFVRCAYLNDKHQTCELIMRCLDLYGDVTCLQMGIAADDKKFLHEDACQALLTNIWYDKIDPVQERYRLVINIFTFGIAQIFISIYEKRFNKYSKIISSTHSKRQLKKNGINYTDNYDINQSVFKHFIHFHNRPIVKYCYTCCGYILFLFLFSYFMLFEFGPFSKMNSKIHWSEILTMITVSTMLVEEVRQFFSEDDRSLMGKIRSYFNLNNRISNLCLILPAYLLFYIGLVLHFTQGNSQNFSYARIVMSIDLELWFIRSVLFIGIASNLGPKIVMIRKMTNDLLLFIIVIVIFIFGYGITSRSMTGYATTNLSGRKFFHDVVYPVYYFVYGSVDNERTQLAATPNASTSIATQVIFAFHMLVVNILLINLLIALFSFTINDIQTQAHYVWAYDRYEIVRTYHARPALFPPFTFLISIVQCCQRCWRTLFRNRCANKKLDDDQSSCFKMIPMNDHVDYAWSQFERYTTNGYIRQLLDEQAAVFANGMTTDIISKSSPTNDYDLKHIKTLISDLKGDLEESRIEGNKKSKSMESTITNLQSRFVQMETRFDRWHKEMKEVNTSLNWIMTTMTNAKMSESEPPLIEDIYSVRMITTETIKNKLKVFRLLSLDESIHGLINSVIFASFLIYLYVMSLSGTESFSQQQEHDTIPNRYNHQLNREHTTVGQPLCQQDQLATAEVCIDMSQKSSNDR